MCAGKERRGLKLHFTSDDLYPQKLAMVLGKGARLERLLKAYPIEGRFKEAGLEEIGTVIGIKNLDSKIMQQLAELDQTYNELTTFRYGPDLSVAPTARCVMGIDTEYLLSPLDSIQFVIKSGETLFAGLIFTNSKLAEAVTPVAGVNLLREVIQDFQPEVIVGHNFNCDITVLERAYGEAIPELHTYDDTMKMARKSHIANITGSAALKKLVQQLFAIKGLNVHTAYEDLATFVEYGVMDAVFPLYLREFLLSGQKPRCLRPERIDYLVHHANRLNLKYAKIHFPDE